MNSVTVDGLYFVGIQDMACRRAKPNSNSSISITVSKYSSSSDEIEMPERFSKQYNVLLVASASFGWYLGSSVTNRPQTRPLIIKNPFFNKV